MRPSRDGGDGDAPVAELVRGVARIADVVFVDTSTTFTDAVAQAAQRATGSSSYRTAVEVPPQRLHAWEALR